MSKLPQPPPQYMPKDIREAWDGIPKALRREPKCSGCNVGVCRPKCFFELNPVDCPRHEQKREWEAKIREVITPKPDPRTALAEASTSVKQALDCVRENSGHEKEEARASVSACIGEELVPALVDAIVEGLDDADVIRVARFVLKLMAAEVKKR